MAYNEQLSNRIREALANTTNVDEKAMFGGLCFMVNDKMCIGVVKDEMMCRIDPAKYEEVLEKQGCRPMDFAGKEMKGFVFVDEHGMKNNKDFNYWIDICLEFNPKAKASKRRNSTLPLLVADQQKHTPLQATSTISQLTDHLFRHESGKMVAVLTKIFGTENLELSEDVVQETFIAAVQVWSLKGLPDNPSAWMMKAAKNKAIDAIRRNKFSSQVDFSDPERKLLRSEYTLTTQVEKLWQDDAVTDDLLRMMFACCHPGINTESQVTLILKTLCGFSTEEIARAFLSSNDTISKRLYRTKEFFRNNKIKPEFPTVGQLKEKTDAVLRTIYLIFNEGYNSTHADELIRKDLLDQALYLCRLLCDNTYTQLPQVYAAMALMCFHAARTDARIGMEGEIILLAQQDRSKWDHNLIQQGNDHLNKAAYGDNITSYHIEAAIAYEHCIAPTFEETNWQNILVYYDMLLTIHPSAVVALNRLTVIYKIHGALATIEQLQTSPYLDEWEKHYLYYSLLGEVYSITDKQKAKEFFQKAISLTNAEAEKKLLGRKIQLL